MAILDVEGLVTGYENRPILEDVNISVSEAEFVGVVGPNGAGKSTLFKAIMGYLPAWEGTIRFKGEDIAGRRTSTLIREGIGYVPQIENVFPDMTVEENIRMGGYVIDDDDVLEAQTEELYELFPRLKDRKQQKVYTMSGGERKMVAVARAVVTEPELILFDEPSAGLMPKYVDDVFEKLNEIQDRRGTSFLTIEQNVKRILQNTDRTYVLRDGKMYMERPSAELLEDEDLQRAYLGGSKGEGSV